MLKKTFSALLILLILIFISVSKSWAQQGPQAGIIGHETDLCLAKSGKDNTKKANCYIDGYTSAVMQIKLLSESLTDKFPPNFSPWAESLKLWSSYQTNEDKVIKQVFAPKGNPASTVNGARSFYIIGLGRLELIEGYYYSGFGQ